MAEMRPYFKEIVENIFNRWSALKLAVEHGMAGHNGLQTAIEMVNYVTDCCVTNPKVDQENLIDLLEDVMDQEFHTICDDDSIKEISHYLIKYLIMLKEGKLEEIKVELSQLPMCEMWIVAGRKINYVTIDESSSEDEDDDMNTTEGNTMSMGPSTCGSTMQVQEEDMVDPGWTVVKKKK
ncbi:unnamed protein product [Diamesa serratosioi]